MSDHQEYINTIKLAFTEAFNEMSGPPRFKKSGEEGKMKYFEVSDEGTIKFKKNFADDIAQKVVEKVREYKFKPVADKTQQIVKEALEKVCKDVFIFAMKIGANLKKMCSFVLS